MLKYGDIQIVSNGISKTLNPRNLTYRQNIAVSNAVSSSQNSSQLTLTQITNNNGASGTTSFQDIAATTGDFTTINTNNLYVDTIKLKTSSNNQIYINNNLNITDNILNPSNASYLFNFTSNSSFYSNSLSLNSPIVKLVDNVIQINSSVKSSANYNFLENIKFDSALSGFTFPNINQTDGILVQNNAMLLLPAQYYLDFNTSFKTLGFSKYSSSNYYFGNDTIGNNIRFTKSNYNFDKDTTSSNKTPLNYTSDATLNSINSFNNLLNIEAKNISLGNGDLVLLNGIDYNPTNPNNTPQGKSFNFKFWDINNLNTLNVFKLEKNKATFNVAETILNNNITVNNTSIIPKLQFQNNNNFTIGRKNLENLTLPDLDFIQFSYDRNTNKGKISFLQPIDVAGGSQGVSLITPVLNFNGNGEAYFANNLNFYSNGNNIVTFNSNYVNITPQLNLTGTNPILKFSPSEFKIIDISSNPYIGFNSDTATTKFYQPIDLSANGIIQYGTSINFKNQLGTLATLSSSSFDLNGNLNLNTNNTQIKFNTRLNFLDQLNLQYLGFDSTSQNVNFYRPLNFIGSGIINVPSGNNISFTSGATNLFTVSPTSFTTLANFTLLNPSAQMILPNNGSLSFVDTTNTNYLSFSTLNQTVQFFKPIQFANSGQGVQSAIQFATQLDLINGSNTNVASFNQSALILNGSLVFNNNSNIQVKTGSLSFLDSSGNNFLVLDNTAKLITFYQPIQLSNSGNINFISSVNFVNSGTNIFSITPTLASLASNGLSFTNTNPFLNFSNNEFLFNDTDVTNNNYIGLNKNLKTIKIYKPLDLQTNGRINYTTRLNFNNGTSNILSLSNSSLIFPSSNPSINISSGQLSISDNSGNPYIGFDLSSNSIKYFKPINSNLSFSNLNPNIQINSGELKFIDSSSNNYLGFNTTSKQIAFYQGINTNLIFSNLNPAIQFSRGEFAITDLSSNKYFGADISSQTLRLYKNLNSNLGFSNLNPQIRVGNGELTITDFSSNKFMGFDASSQKINFYKPFRINQLDFSGNGLITFDQSLNLGDTLVLNKSGVINMPIANPIFRVNSGALNFQDKFQNNYLTIDTVNNLLSTSTPFNPSTINFTANEFIIYDSNNVKYMGFNQLNRTIRFYQSLDLSGATLPPAPVSTINFNPPVFFISDTSGTRYLIFDSIAKSTRVYSPFDFSYGGNIIFGTDLKFNNGTSDVLTISSSSVNFTNNIFFNNNNPSINVSSGNFSLNDSNGNPYFGIDVGSVQVKSYKPMLLSNNLIFSNQASIVINSGQFNFTDATTSNYFQIDISNGINKSFKPLVLNDDLIFSNTSKIKITSGELNFTDVSSSNYFGFDTSNNINISYKQLNLSSNLRLANNSKIIISSGELAFTDASASNYFGLDTSGVSVKVYKSLNLSDNLNFTNQANVNINYKGELYFTDASASNYFGIDTSGGFLKAYKTMVLSNNLNFANQAQIQIDVGEFKFVDTLASNYLGIDTVGGTIKSYKPMNLSSNLSFQNQSQVIINYLGTLNFVDTYNTNFFGIDTNNALINLYKPTVLANNLTFSSPTNNKIKINGGEMNFTDAVSSNYLGIDTSGVLIKAYKPTLFYDNISFNSAANIVTNSGALNFTDTSANIYLGIDTNNKLVRTNQPLVLGNNLSIPNTSKIIISSGEVNFTDALSTNYLGIDTSGATIKAYRPLILSNNLSFLNNSQIIAGRGELVFVDASGNNYFGIDTSGSQIKSYRALTLSNNLNFVNAAQIKVNTGEVVFTDASSSSYLGINTTLGTVKSYKPLDPISITFSTTNFLIKDNNGVNYMGFNKSNQTISFYQPVSIPTTINSINFSVPQFTITDVSGGSYMIYDSTTASTKVMNLLDLSANGNISYGSSLNFNTNGVNMMSFNMNNNTPSISYKNNLTFISTKANVLYAQPIIKYNILSDDCNNFEKKYLGKTVISGGAGLIQYNLKNIIDASGEQITFTGKIVSRDLLNNSASFLLQGYTNYVDANNPNNLGLNITNLYSSDPEYWNVNAVYMFSTDLVIEVTSNQSTDTSWVISIESISV